MLSSVKLFFLKIIPLLVLVLSNFCADGQFPEFRITDDGQYQYLGNPVASTVFDETQGTYYKPITSRTFFLQAQERKYISSDISYDNFLLLSVEEQRTLLKEPSVKPLDCSIGQVIPEGCIVYKGVYEQKIYKADGTSVNKSATKKSVQKSESAKIILNAQ